MITGHAVSGLLQPADTMHSSLHAAGTHACVKIVSWCWQVTIGPRRVPRRSRGGARGCAADAAARSAQNQAALPFQEL